MALIDLTGQKFGKLTVLYRDTEAEKLKKDRHAMWKCQCDCGNLTTVVGKDLRAGKTQSCGCLQKERASQSNGSSLLGKRFGMLTVIEQASSKNHRTYWKCKCDCGNEIIACARELSCGDTNSCGCLYSKGEAQIEKLLQNLQYKYQKQITFSDFQTESGYKYRYDFGILNNENVLMCLIEYNGKQHYSYSGGWNTQEYLKLTQKRDQLKKEYCQKNNIPLIVIPYTDYNKLDVNYLKERIEQFV